MLPRADLLSPALRRCQPFTTHSTSSLTEGSSVMCCPCRARHAAPCRADLGRREQLLASTAAPIVLAALVGTDDPTTVVNSILSAYGLPKLPGGSAFRLYDELSEDFLFEYPRSWVGRSNSQREGVYVADFNTADKAVVEIFPEPAGSEGIAAEVVRRVVMPGSDIGGDARLIMPDERRIKAEAARIGNTVYTYVRFPSETVTRSGYQIRRKNFAVAAARRGLMYSLVASARSDQYNADKERVLQHIVQSFRLRS